MVFGGRFERSFFDVRVFNPGDPSNCPFQSAGGMGDAAAQVYNRLAGLLSEKNNLSYGETMGWIRCRLSFALVRSAIMCIHGARSRLHSPALEIPIDVQIAEVHL